MIKRLLTSFSIGLIAVLGIFTFMSTATTYAATCSGPVAGNPGDSGILGFPNWHRGLECDGDKASGTYHVVMTDIPKTVWTVVLNAVDMLLRVVGILAVVMILVSAFRYLTNGGSEEKIRSAKTSLLQAIVGLVIALLASTIVGFVVGGLSNGW
jgi:hypothetical protein